MSTQQPHLRFGALLVAMGLLMGSEAKANPDAAYAEELVDIVLQHCQAGDAELAKAIRQAILQQLQPPPEIQALLDQIVQNGCKPRTVQSPSNYFELALTMGYDDNVNQGINANTITLGSVLKPITLLLDSDYKPASAMHTAATATYQRSTGNGWVLRADVGHKQIHNYSPLNTTGMSLTARYALKPMGIDSAVQFGWSQSWLSSSPYRRTPSLDWQSTLGNPRQPWVLQAQMQQIDHSTDTTQDARIHSLGATRYIRWGQQGITTLGAGLLYDQSHQQRAGGHRQGQSWQVAVQHPWGKGQFQAQWSQVRWTTANDFSPGLVDHRRENQTTQLSLAYHLRLEGRSRVFMELQHKNAKDNIPLYAHTSNGLVAGWIQQWQ